jgi:hypothetical protein
MRKLGKGTDCSRLAMDWVVARTVVVLDRETVDRVTVSGVGRKGTRNSLHRDDLAYAVEAFLVAGPATKVQQRRDVSLSGFQIILGQDNLPAKHALRDRNRLTTVLTKDSQIVWLGKVVAHNVLGSQSQASFLALERKRFRDTRHHHT